MTGRLFAGTSGFAYPSWSPTFYAPGLREDELLRAYASRLSACELNSTYYRRPTETTIRSWVARTPATFRFALKAQRGGSFRALGGADPAGSVAWLTEPLHAFGDRLGTVLFRVPADMERDDHRLRALLEAWPARIPITLEFQHPSWLVDETFACLREHRAVLCATDLDEADEPPTIRLTGPLLYLRLRRTCYAPADLDAWAARVIPFLDAGLDVHAYFRHDETGQAPGRALDLAERVEVRRARQRGEPSLGDPAT
jgi:uncharacterized protein YecE (DUF72 family)